MEIQPTVATPPIDGLPTTPNRADQLMEVAQSLEAAFLAEMLKAAGTGETPEAFGGGLGEDQFASFLREQQAMQMTKAGGIGLAQAMFDAMVEQVCE